MPGGEVSTQPKPLQEGHLLIGFERKWGDRSELGGSDGFWKPKYEMRPVPLQNEQSISICPIFCFPVPSHIVQTQCATFS
jgi:hypothetical protein